MPRVYNTRGMDLLGQRAFCSYLPVGDFLQLLLPITNKLTVITHLIHRREINGFTAFVPIINCEISWITICQYRSDIYIESQHSIG